MLRPSIAFFDLDLTVLRINSGMSWMKFLYRRGEISRYEIARAALWHLGYRLSLLNVEAVAERMAASMAGDSEPELAAKAERWYRECVADQVAPGAIAEVRELRDSQCSVVLLTSATRYVAEPVGRVMEAERVLCTELEVAGGRFTGRIQQLCFGAAKVGIARNYAQSRGVGLLDCAFYSDSFTDLPLLREVGVPVAVNPDPRLRRRARRSGWRVEHWR